MHLLFPRRQVSMEAVSGVRGGSESRVAFSCCEVGDTARGLVPALPRFAAVLPWLGIGATVGVRLCCRRCADVLRGEDGSRQRCCGRHRRLGRPPLRAATASPA